MKTFLQLLFHMIKHIALYGCEFWRALTSCIQEEKHLHVYNIAFKKWEVENLSIF